jgi:hypothetical protein
MRRRRGRSVYLKTAFRLIDLPARMTGPVGFGPPLRLTETVNFRPPPEGIRRED